MTNSINTSNPIIQFKRNISKLTTLLGIMMVLLLCSAASVAAPSTSFSHKDWELVCDNTLTCRAAGYQSDDYSQNAIVSVLLTRKAGAMSSVTAQVQLGNWQDERPHSEQPQKQVDSLLLNLWLNQKNLGSLALDPKTNIAKLNEKQTQALLQALKQAQLVEFRNKQSNWVLSSDGSSAVLLKMDDVQGRVGTATAIIRKGNASLKQIKVAALLPVIQTVKIKDIKPKSLNLASSAGKKLLATLHKRGAANAEDCETLSDASQFEGQALNVYTLNPKTALVEVPCWRGAYNEGLGYWVMDANLQKIQQLVTLSGSGYSRGEIDSSQKGRGLGDCWSIAQWRWNGQRFELIYAAGDGQCKGFAGGAWQLPSYVSKTVLTKP